jgi:tRNA 2-selenouridine synthase
VILDVEQFLALREKLPVIDVRSEGEYEAGHIASAVNIPLLNNGERVIVGTVYKQQGQREAIKAGFKVVGPRLLDIIEAADKYGNEFIVHCWRGGMRSSNFCQFVGMAGKKTHVLQGGYKAYRTFALGSFKRPFNFQVISGYTGSGKSELLRKLHEKGEQIIDLEALASHKGSVFGGLALPAQPTTEQFQNDLFEVINKLDLTKPIWIEDESIAIGKIFLPNDLWTTMRAAPVVVVNVPREVRVQRLVAEYGTVAADAFHEALKGITKKLGGQNYKIARELLYAGDMGGSIEVILNYYDRAYGNAMNAKQDRILFTTDWNGNELGAFTDELISQIPRMTTPSKH